MYCARMQAKAGCTCASNAGATSIACIRGSTPALLDAMQCIAQVCEGGRKGGVAVPTVPAAETHMKFLCESSCCSRAHSPRCVELFSCCWKHVDFPLTGSHIPAHFSSTWECCAPRHSHEEHWRQHCSFFRRLPEFSWLQWHCQMQSLSDGKYCSSLCFDRSMLLSPTLCSTATHTRHYCPPTPPVTFTRYSSSFASEGFLQSLCCPKPFTFLFFLNWEFERVLLNVSFQDRIFTKCIFCKTWERWSLSRHVLVGAWHQNWHWGMPCSHLCSLLCS